MKQQEIFRQLVDKKDLESFTKMIKECRDAYITPLNIKDNETLEELKKDYSRLNGDYENDLCMYVVKLIEKNNIDRDKVEKIIEFIEIGFHIAFLSGDSSNTLSELYNIYKKYDIDLNREKIDFAEVLDSKVLNIITSYYERDNLKNKENGTKISVDFYAKHYMENISLVAKTAYIITEIGDLDRFSQEWINDIEKFIEKRENTQLIN